MHGCRRIVARRRAPNTPGRLWYTGGGPGPGGHGYSRSGTLALGGYTSMDRVRYARLGDDPPGRARRFRDDLGLVRALADSSACRRRTRRAARLLADAFGPRRRVEIFWLRWPGRRRLCVRLRDVFEFLALPTLYLEDLFVLPNIAGGASAMRCCILRPRGGAAGLRADRLGGARLEYARHRLLRPAGGRHLDDWRSTGWSGRDGRAGRRRIGDAVRPL